uniref:Pardaxin P-1 n=1 Tax=Pardachirus pavoninus TaxID=8286 RepID=PAP1_PARPV|nr:RecName: Full=Pardaxin P-1; AltName: Full=Pardaxin Pa1 [Pardachirus pavoninus]prf//1208397A pardaxin P1 [Pardachirus pavoninus]
GFFALIPKIISSPLFKTLLSAVGSALSSSGEQE